MKKIQVLFSIVLFSLFLIGCSGDTSKKSAEEIIKNIEFSYIAGDGYDKITDNFTIDEFDFKNFDFKWESLSEHLTISGNTVSVKRPEVENIEAKLKVSLMKKEKIIASKEFSFTIIKREINVLYVTIDYNYDGKVEKLEIKSGQKVTEPSIEREGFKLLLWTKALIEYDFNEVVTKDITLKAIWEKESDEKPGEEAFSIIYDLTTLSGQNLPVDNAAAETIFAHPKLKEVEVLSLFNGNGPGGTYEDSSGFLKMGSSKNDGLLNLTLEQDTKISKVVVFAEKWNEKATDTMIINGQSINLTDVKGDSHTIEFQTPSNILKIDTIKRAFVFRIELYGNGSSGSQKEEVEVTFDFGDSKTVKKTELGKLIDSPVIPQKEGYRFVGWTYKNELFDITKHPIYENVTLVAKWQKDDEVEVPGIELPDTTKTIASIISKPLDSQVEVEAVITGIIGSKYVIISDKDGEQAIYMYYAAAETLPSNIVVGDYVKVSGTLSEYNGLKQIAKPQLEVIGSGYQIPKPFKLAVSNIKEKDQGKRVDFTGLVVESIPDMSGNFNITFKNGNGSITVRVETDHTGWAAKINHAGVGGEINLNGIHVGWYNGLQFMASSSSIVEVTKANGTEEPTNPIEPENPIEVPSGDYDKDLNGYYKTLTGLTGTPFRNELTSITKTRGRATGSTSEVKSVDNYNGRNYNIYDGFGSYGNREHVVPARWFRAAGLPEDDLHNLRAAVVSTNTKRDSYPFGEGSGVWVLNSNKFYPGDEHVGDVARIVLYIHLRYNLKLSDVGNLNMFLKWHEQDPVNDFERSRNGKIEGIQQNRNPFIDYPDFVGYMWGTSAKESIFMDTLFEASILLNNHYYYNDRREQFVA